MHTRNVDIFGGQNSLGRNDCCRERRVLIPVFYRYESCGFRLLTFSIIVKKALLSLILFNILKLIFFYPNAILPNAFLPNATLIYPTVKVTRTTV